MHVGSPFLWCLFLSVAAHLAAAAWFVSYTPPNAAAARPGFEVQLTAATPIPRARGVAPSPVARAVPEPAVARSSRAAPTETVAPETARDAPLDTASTVTPDVVRPLGPTARRRADAPPAEDAEPASARRVIPIEVASTRKSPVQPSSRPQPTTPAQAPRAPAVRTPAQRVLSAKQPRAELRSAAATTPARSPSSAAPSPTDGIDRTASAAPTGGDTGRTAPPRAGSENPPPVYPWVARLHRQQGRVVLRVAVRSDGATDDLEVVLSSGYRSLDNAALAAVSKWYFQPATRAGQSVAATVDVPIVFRLEDGE